MSDATVAEPIPIVSPMGKASGWFVAITVGEKILGFVQLEQDGTFSRFSTFQQRPGSLSGCPDARSWTDPAFILKIAKGHAPRSGRLGKAFLTYDGNLARLAWAVPLRARGRRDTIYVAGEYVYRHAADEL
ncbi:MAG: hypothetical protein ACRENE_16775 [Polyangiaceae bacterium]